MFIKTCTRTKNGKKYKTQYLTEGYRDKDGKVKHRHVMSLSKLPEKLVLTLKDALKGKSEIEKVSLENLKLMCSKEFGGIAIFGKLFDNNFKKIIDKKYYKEIKAITINKIFNPKSKNSLHNWIRKTDLGYNITNKNKLYESMDYLEENQKRIEKKLYEKKKRKCDFLLYDITSTYFEGKGAENICKYGYSRDHRKDRIQVNIGLVTDKKGKPFSVEIFEGNTNDNKTIQSRVEKLKKDFGIEDITFIFDRGMKSKMNLEYIKKEKYDYITALSHAELKKKAEENQQIQLSIFDKKDLAEFTEEETNKETGEVTKIKHVLCHNPSKSERDKQTRMHLIEKTEKRLKEIQNFKRKYTDQQIQDKVSKSINRFKCEKYISYEIKNGKLTFNRNEKTILRDEKYDGFYMIESTDTKIGGGEAEKKYKSLQLVERAFDDVKNHIKIRPVFHYKESRIKGHIFSCFMSYLLLHQFRESTKELLKKHTLDDLLTELTCIHKSYFKIDKFILEKVTELNDIQKNLLSIFKVRCCN